MAKKKVVKKAVGGKSKASSAKHIVPNGFWQQVLALLALVFAGILFLAIAGIGGGAPNEIFKALRSLVGLIAFAVPFIVVYLALKKMFTEGNVLPVSMHFGFFSFMAAASATIAVSLDASTKVKNSSVVRISMAKN